MLIGISTFSNAYQIVKNVKPLPRRIPIAWGKSDALSQFAES